MTVQKPIKYQSVSLMGHSAQVLERVQPEHPSPNRHGDLHH